MNQTEAREAVTKWGSALRAARESGIAKSTFADILHGKTKQARVGAKPEQTHAGPPRKTLADFRAEHDKDFIIPRRIKEGLKLIGWEYETAFAKICGVSMADISTYREQFLDHVVPIRRDGKRAWAGTPSMATEMRKMVS